MLNIFPYTNWYGCLNDLLYKKWPNKKYKKAISTDGFMNNFILIYLYNLYMDFFQLEAKFLNPLIYKVLLLHLIKRFET